MASANGTYLPNLAKCLSGDELLLSWDDILQTLLSHNANRTPFETSFFSDAHVKDLLSNPVPTFLPRSEESRSAFDSSTASINITPSSSHQYDIERIKENALWLSAEANLGEVDALRLTLLEWQYQPEARLRAGFSDAELASLRDLYGVEYCESAGLIPGSPLNRSESIFDSADGVRARLVQLYFRERVRLLAVAKEILQLRIEEDAAPAPDTRQDALPEPTTNGFQDVLEHTSQTISSCIETLQSQRSWPIEEQYLSQLCETSTTSHLQCIAVTLEILLLYSTHSEELVTAETLLQWLRLMQDVDHFTSFQSDIPLQQTVIEHIRTVSACATLSLLQPAAILLHLAEHPETLRAGYIHEHQFLADIHGAFMSFAGQGSVPASLGILSWALLLLEVGHLATDLRDTSDSRTIQKAIASNPQDTRRSSLSSAGSSHQLVFEDILREIPPGPHGEDAPNFLLAHVLQGTGVLDYISHIVMEQQEKPSLLSPTILRQLQDLVKQALPILGYSQDLLSAQTAVLALSKAVEEHKRHYDPAISFIGDRYLMESFFDVAAARFPYEALPFLRLCKLLARADVFDDGTQYISFRLRQLDSFTQLATEGFSSYRTIREDENANLVSLDNAVGIFDFQRHKYLTQDGVQLVTLNIMPAQTIGEVISESMPPAIKWQHTFSGFALLGKWIELHREGLLSNIISEFEEPDDVVAEAVFTLVAVLENTYTHIESTSNKRRAQTVCDEILEESSAMLGGEVDLVNCIFELSEHQLQASRGQTPSIASRDLLSACVDFLTIYAEIRPAQFWSLTMRSSIFGMSGAKRNALSFTGGVELPIQDFRLLESCSRLFKVIVSIALPLSLQDADGPQSLQLRRGRVKASQRLNSSVITNCSEVMLSALEAMGGWAFRDQMQRQRVLSNITSAFYDIIYFAFGSGEDYDSPTIAKMTFMTSATTLVQALQNPGLQGTGVGPLLHQLIVAVVNPKVTNGFGVPMMQTKSSLKLVDLVLQCSRLSNDGNFEFESRMLSLMPVVVRLGLVQPTSATNASALLYSILRAIPAGTSSSILGHLGAASSIALVDILRHSYRKPQQSTNVSLLWQIYSQFVTLDQQWMAVVLVTGAPPGRQRKDDEHPTRQTQGKPCLQLAVDGLSKPNLIETRTLAAILKFLLEAQRNWPSVSDIIAAQSELFPELIAWVCKCDISSKQEIDQAIHNEVAALVTELAVLHLHRLMSLKDEKVFTVFIPLLSWLAKNAIDVAAYNTSLHVNLKKNFTMKYEALDPSLFRSSGLVHTSYGPSFLFEIEMADKIIGEDVFWKNEKAGDQSFRTEFQRANVNLSIVDSELRLLRSLEYLGIEHAAFFARNRDVARIMAQMITNCLISNSQQTLTEKLFDTVFQTRADLAITLLRPLVGIKARGSDFPTLLNSAWSAVRFRNGSYEAAISNGDLQYWRSCLSILLMCLQFHVEKKVRKSNVGGQHALLEIDPFNGMYCEIARDIVGEGLQTVVTSLQVKHQDRSRFRDADTNSMVTARDVSLLLNILQTIRRLPTIPQFTVQLSEIFVSTGVAQSCIVLYSWSHLLADDGQPVFADLAISFLAPLSSLTIVAEELAVEGIFTRLLSAKFTQHLQSIPNGVSHLDKRSNGPLLYSVWVSGVLPICLNLLHSVGGGVAGEVSDFLNQFPAQLNRATMALSGASTQAGAGGGILTLPAATELATLSLISYILLSFREAGASAGIDPDAISSLEGFEQNKRTLAEDIRDALQQDQSDRKRRTIATNGKEAAWQKLGTLDQKIVAQLKQAQMCLRRDIGEDDKI